MGNVAFDVGVQRNRYVAIRNSEMLMGCGLVNCKKSYALWTPSYILPSWNNLTIDYNLGTQHSGFSYLIGLPGLLISH